MRKFLSATIIAIVLGLAVPAGIGQAASTDPIQSITSSGKYDLSTGNYNYSSVLAMKTAPVYQLIDGQFVKTNRTISPQSDWKIQNTIETKSGAVYYQIADNSYVQSSDPIAIGYGVTSYTPLYVQK